MRAMLRIVLIAVCAATAVRSYAEEKITPIVGYVLSEPRVAYMSDGTYAVNYELVVANATMSGYAIQEIRVVDPRRSDAVIKTLNADEIARESYVPGGNKSVSKLAPGLSGYIRINLVFRDKDTVPAEVEHVIVASAETPIPMVPEPSAGRVGRASVSSDRAVVIGPPMRGGNWVGVVIGAGGAHRKSIMPIGGTWVAPERWAVDWVQLAETGKMLTGPIGKNESYPQYGREIIAVADGRVVSAQDGMPDIPPGKPLPLQTIDEYPGNCIVQDIGGGYCAVYAHLQPGSLKVKTDDTVKKGQVIGLLGNSGNTTGPHLHFHIVHGTAPMGSDGVPYVIDAYTVRGTAVSSDDLQTQLERGEAVTMTAAKDSGRRTMEMPADLAVVDFGK